MIIAAGKLFSCYQEAACIIYMIIASTLDIRCILTFTAIQDGVDDRKLWAIRRFTSFSTGFQSYQDTGGTFPLTGMVQTCR